MKYAVIVALALVLCGCANKQAGEAPTAALTLPAPTAALTPQLSQEMHDECVSYGYKEGTPEFPGCMERVRAQAQVIGLAAEEEAADRQVPAPTGAGLTQPGAGMMQNASGPVPPYQMPTPRPAPITAPVALTAPRPTASCTTVPAEGGMTYSRCQ